MQSNRRQFLYRAGTLSAGLALLPPILNSYALGNDKSLPASDMINMVLIGCGGMGRADLHNFLGFGDVRVVAVCDVDENQSAGAKKMVDEKYGNSDCRVYNDFRILLEKEKPDAAVLALPDHWHALMACSVAEKKIHIYGEKPLARSVREGRAIVEAVNRNQIVWQTGSQQRSEANFHHACELVINGRIGRVAYVEVSMHNGGNYIGNPPVVKVPEGVDWDMWLGPAPKVPFRGVLHGNWRFISDYSGGQLTDWAGHHIDIANWGLGLENTGPVTIEGKGRANNDGIYDVPVEYDFTCVYANGITMRVANRARMEQLNPIWQGKDIGILFQGSSGWIHVSRGRLSASDPDILKEKIGSSEVRLRLSTNHHRNFIDCIRSGEETVAPAEAGHRAISVALLGEIAMKTGQKLEWDPGSEKFSPGSRFATGLLQRPYHGPWKFPGDLE
jgi:predicted dehydrogenase